MAVPAVLSPSEEDATAVKKWKAEFYETVERQATMLCGLLDGCHGLDVIFPEGGESRLGLLAVVVPLYMCSRAL